MKIHMNIRINIVAIQWIQGQSRNSENKNVIGNLFLEIIEVYNYL